jgi:hypothetical protein
MGKNPDKGPAMASPGWVFALAKCIAKCHIHKIDSRKNDSWVQQIASTVNVRIFSYYHAGPSNNARPTSEKLLRFRRSFSLVMDPPVIQ